MGAELSRPNDKQMVTTWKRTGIVGLRDRALKEMPPAVGQVGADAKVLDATNNQLSVFPPVIEQLTSLQRLVLSQNLLTHLPGSAISALANSLKVLLLESNRIEWLPDELGSLVRLEKLSIRNNRMAKLNPCIGE